ncbi:MAG: fatty acid desaturase, partial [Phycisphaerales bacterium]|nr:fatty acid desaturase [Phycisphaerales bacterium]
MSTLTASPSTDAPTADGDRIDWLRCLPFIALHIAVLGVIWVGWSWFAITTAVVLYFVRMFAVTAFYHRYFSHRAFKTSRVMQFLMAALAGTAAQRGPLWWAAHHRHHHVHSDHEPDVHSPSLRGLLMSHCGWFMTRDAYRTNTRIVRDWLRFRELRLLDRFDWFMPLVLALSLYSVGALLEVFAPGLNVTGMQLFIWGFV